MEDLIFLIGFMGVGKTTMGKRLASKLNADFIDTDDLLEKQFQCSINAYFQTYGEADFRKKEKALIDELKLKKRRAVIAVGGGLPCYNNNMDVLNNKGMTIYLKRPVRELWQRLKQGKHKRPLISKLTDEQLLVYIEEKLEEREFFYSKAKFTLDREHQDISDFIQLLHKEN